MIRRIAAVAVTLVAAAVATTVPAGAAPTLPPPATVAVIGDFGSGTAAEQSVAALIARARPTAIVTTGDNVYDSADYAGLVGRYYGPWIARATFLPALGNHDYAEGVDAFDDYFGYLKDLRVYTRIVGDIQFFVLDSEAALRSDRDLAWQRNWLAKSARESRARWQVVVLHHPPYSSGAVHGSTPAMQWPYRSWGVDLVLSGHEHQYERIRRGGLTYIVDGAGGKDLYGFGSPVSGSRVRIERFGALFLSSTPSALTGDFWSADDRLRDSFTISQ